MSKKIYLFSLVLLTLAFTACSETEEAGRYDNWRARNEAFIDSIATAHADLATRGNLDSIHMVSYRGVPIYFKKKTPVGEVVDYKSNSPFYTSTVTVYYKATNRIGDILQGTFSGTDPSVGFSPTSSFVVSARDVGFAEALQRMKVGERWEIYVPWKYGYGNSDYTISNTSVTVVGYSSLIYDVQLLSFE